VHALLLAAVVPALAGAGTTDLTPQKVSALKQSVVRILGESAVGDVLGTGSGFVVDASGVVATNRHVVDGAGSRMVAEFPNGTRKKVLGVLIEHSKRDVALVRIEAGEYQPLALGSSESLVESGAITVIGAPLGLGWTVAPGTISAIREHGLSQDLRGGEVEEFDDPDGKLLQCDVGGAAGNSGSPVINGAGEVVGIINSGMGRQGTLMFAVPVEAVKEAMARAGGTAPLSAAVAVDQGQRARWRNLGVSAAFFAALGVYAAVRRRRAAPPRRR